METAEKNSCFGAGLELPIELSDAVWLAKGGTITPTGRHWEFQKGGVYQIKQGAYQMKQGVPQRTLLIYLRDEGIHHVFRSYRAEWLTTYTDQQLLGLEVLEMEKDMKHCPHCGGKVLKVEIVSGKAGTDGQFLGQVSCLDKRCGAVTRWKITVPRGPAEEQDKQQAAAMEQLIAAWNRRG